MKRSLFLSVTIATFKRCSLLEKSLTALANQTLSSSSYEIIICDSHSDDGTDRMVQRFSEKFPEIKIKHLHTNNILAAKRNLGIEESSGDVVVFFDDDCIASQDCLQNYYDLFASHETKNIVYCGEVRFPPEWVAASNYYKFRDSRHFGGGHRKDIKSLDYKTIVVMNMAFNKSEFLKKIGSVDENFIGYGCEDQDLGWRLQKERFNLIKSNALVFHYEPSGNIIGYSKKLFHTARDGMATLLERNPSAVSGLGLKFQLLDPDYPDTPIARKLLFKIIREIIFIKLFENIVSHALTKFDHVKLFYFPFLYKFVLACAYARGAKARAKRLQVFSSWYD